jgi:hypothetical protein
MNVSKRVNPIRGYAVGAVLSALILLSPAIGFLSLIAAEALVDLLLVGGTAAAFSATVAIGLVLSRNCWRRALDFRAVKGDFGSMAHV